MFHSLSSMISPFMRIGRWVILQGGREDKGISVGGLGVGERGGWAYVNVLSARNRRRGFIFCVYEGGFGWCWEVQPELYRISKFRREGFLCT